MKYNALYPLYLATAMIVLVAILAGINFDFGWIFYLTVLGQIILVWAVYSVLRDDYTTEKTFDDFYEDRPDLGNNHRS
jgi:hypothetical protein